MRVLLTGASGFVGRYLIEHLLSCGDEVIATDRHIPDAASFNKQVNWQTLDVTDLDSCHSLIKRFQPEAIYHLAGIAFVPEAENNFDRALLVNVGGTNNILRACHLLQNGSTVLLISSAEVYGRIVSADLPITEATPLRPANNYSLSKHMAEAVCQRYGQFGYVRPVVARPFNHIGPGQDDRFVVPSFAKQLAMIAKGQQEALIRVGNLQARRDFSDVRDIVRGYRLAVEKGKDVYNFGAGKSMAIQNILDQLIAISGLKVDIETDPSRLRSVDVLEVYGSYAKAEKELGWRPEIDISQTLRDVYQYFINQ